MYKNILLPIDLENENSWKKSLPTALDLVRHYKAKLHVLTVVPEITGIGGTLMMPYFPDDWEEKLIKHARNLLKAFVDKNIPASLETTYSVARGSVYAQILAVADSRKTDLILMASHRPGIKDYLIGPNAAHVTRHAPCSVFVVRGD
jgi:nucleotide-binding universal stress UspA family protein